MPFTETQQLNICKIVGITADVLDYVLGFYGGLITAEVESQVADELDRWDTAGGKFVALEPTESNYGVRTDSDNLKNDIRKNIITLLYLGEYANAGSGRLQRS